MKRTWPIIGVKDVGASSAWYLSLLGQTSRETGHDDFDQIRDDDGTILICLHEWGAHGEGPPLRDPTPAAGNGVLFSILVEDFDECLRGPRAWARRTVSILNNATGNGGSFGFETRMTIT